MKAVVLTGPNEFSTKEVEQPRVQADEMLLKMEKAAICGTDIRILEGTKTKGVRYPSVIGHEMSGTLVEVGEHVTGYEIGNRVSLGNVIPCGRCNNCLNDRENACLNRQAMGYEFDGGFAEYVRIPAACIRAGNVVKLPENVTFTAGSLIEPLACCVRGLHNAKVKFSDVVLVIGAGPIGLMHLQLSRLFGARKVIVSEPNAYRREKAVALGADRVVDPMTQNLEEIVRSETDGLGADAIIFAVGIASQVNAMLKLCKMGGTVSLFAGFAGKGECTIEANIIHYNEINVCGSTAAKRRDYLEAAELVKSGKINLDDIATHEYPLDDFRAAYETAKSGMGLKIIIKP